MKRCGLSIPAIVVILFTTIQIFAGCAQSPAQQPASKSAEGTETMPKKEHRFVIVDPGHFHAGLVLKRWYYEGVSSTVDVYAPVGDEFDGFMKLVTPFNYRDENPAGWKYKIYLGEDFISRMAAEKDGDIAILAGRNDNKLEKIAACIESGINVLSDKPMIIEPESFPELEKTVQLAQSKKLLLLDIMTERFEVTTYIQKQLAADPDVFGELIVGSPEKPAVEKISVHHFSKKVAGIQLIRPTWYFNTKVQGEGVVDVTTHLVDTVFWVVFPERAFDYKKDIEMVSAKRWPTVITPEQFENVTGKPFTEDFKLNSDGNLDCYANGSMVYKVDGHFVNVRVDWKYQAPAGTGDTHHSAIRGSKAEILILQGAEQNYKPELYVQPAAGVDIKDFEYNLETNLEKLASVHLPGISFVKEGNRYRISVPDEYRVGHEAHFGQVTDRYLNILNGELELPDWEVPNLLTKYYITTKAVQMSRESN